LPYLCGAFLSNAVVRNILPGNDSSQKKERVEKLETNGRREYTYNTATVRERRGEVSSEMRRQENNKKNE